MVLQFHRWVTHSRAVNGCKIGKCAIGDVRCSCWKVFNYVDARRNLILIFFIFYELSTIVRNKILEIQLRDVVRWENVCEEYGGICVDECRCLSMMNWFYLSRLACWTHVFGFPDIHLNKNREWKFTRNIFPRILFTRMLFFYPNISWNLFSPKFSELYFLFLTYYVLWHNYIMRQRT